MCLALVRLVRKLSLLVEDEGRRVGYDYQSGIEGIVRLFSAMEAAGNWLKP